MEETRSNGGNAYACSHCRDCGYNNFPVSDVCPQCLSLSVDAQTLSSEGVLYSFSSLNKAGSKQFVGYIDLPESIRVFAKLEDFSGDARPFCGMPVTLSAVNEVGNGPQFVFRKNAGVAA